MPVVIAGLVLSFFVMMLFGGTELDRTLLTLLAGRDAPGRQQAASWINAAAAPLTLLLAALAGSFTLAFRARWPDALLLVTVAASGHLLVEAVQTLTLTLRPATDPELFAAPIALYPSGQAAGAAVTGLALAFILTNRFPARTWALAAAALLAAAVGLARIVIGGNWPSDVIGGWALGLAWTLLLLLLARTDLGDGVGRSPAQVTAKRKGGESGVTGTPST